MTIPIHPAHTEETAPPPLTGMAMVYLPVLWVMGWIGGWFVDGLHLKKPRFARPLPAPVPRDKLISDWATAREQAYEAEQEQMNKHYIKAVFKGRHRSHLLACISIGYAALFGLTFTCRIIHTRPWRVFRLDGLRTALPLWAAPIPFPDTRLE